ncbi:unnamed protein product [Brachionus calyciflorus]|uniref:Palmitoyltransferase n=1 Tax=Brachionus calyciflorus TaxID=104777 RepID=A0A813VR75_9BILA|nr:unnamed protein product [Brachionus calyciflorus]
MNRSKNKTGLKNQIRLIYYTFFYNENNDSLTWLETFLAPFAEFMSSLMRMIGIFLVFLVIVLVSNMIYLFYGIILPKIFETTWPNILIHFCFGNWLAVNTVFHYYMGLMTNPGEPPKSNVENIVTMCKKCIAPKPARTHHCSICNKCILKMDHHCPWFNNCIGFYNHRYFLMFCIFMTIDCLYLITYGFHYYQLYVYPDSNMNIFNLILTLGQASTHLKYALYFQLSAIEFFLAFVAIFAVGGLAAINIFIISQGGTNIELKSMRIPCIPSTYSNAKNPYDLGFRTNWKIFLGFTDTKSFIRRVILPSTHKPIGDGVDWSEYFNFERYNSKYKILQV